MIDPKEIIRRRDMREAFTFTIDPADAKDFDDALSFTELTNEGVNELATYQVGVHIADVSFYVKPGTKVDEEAYERGTSVYLVDRVIPMLPEELCNDLCSLRPGEDKLCMSVIFTMDSEARVLKHKICRTVIRSDARLNYEQAQEIIEKTPPAPLKGGGEPRGTEKLEVAIRTLNEMAKKLRVERIAKGAMTIEQEEMRFKLDARHHPVEIYFEKPNESHHLIEEFMLLANRTVAKEAGSGRPFVYRVHDLPDQEKLEDIKVFRKRNSKLLQGEAMQRMIDMLTIRAQAKAVYSTYNIGHYGLAFSHYTHFTSPIRRYPDLMVHRLVDKYILSGKKESLSREEMEIMCEHCSACEQEAAQAERESVKMFQAMWMADHIGETLPGHIVSIMDFGFFVQLDESHCEGLIRMELIEHPERYVLGEAVMVQVIRADVNRSQIDFELAENK